MDLTEFAKFAQELADAARRETLPRWREIGSPENKAADGSFDPVTEADVNAEKAIRALIEARYPDHGISGEECADRPSRGTYGWSLDPIDGTRSFICGLSSWTTLIALLEEGEPVLGLIDAPRLGERYLGYGGAATLHDQEGEHRLATSDCTRLADARFSTTDPYLFKGSEAAAFERIRSAVRTTRFGLDAYGYARVAAGTIDLVIESGLKPHDYNALVPVIRGAGGSVGNWQGGSDITAGQIVVAATPELFAEVIRVLEA